MTFTFPWYLAIIPSFVALLPLGAEADMGFLAIGSHNAEHFHPAMSVDFLQRIGQILSVALARF